MDFRTLLKQCATSQTLLMGHFGLEREGQRVTATGDLARTDFPPTLSPNSTRIQRDFAETQLELVTSVTASLAALWMQLQQVHFEARQALTEGELIWPLSLPPALPVNAENITIAKLPDPAAVAYRQQLAVRYGRRRQMMCGTHFNYEFSPQLVQQLFAAQTEETKIRTFKDKLYLKMARNYAHYRWLVTYLMGATPVSEPHYFESQTGPQEPVRSLRNSRFGYTNRTTVLVSYRSLAVYLSDIDQLVARGELGAAKEFYAPVRLRGGQQVTELKTTGIQYLEIRNLDLNPLAANGIDIAQLKFLHLFLITMLWLDEGVDADQWVTAGDQFNEVVALGTPLSQPARLQEGQRLLAAMRAIVIQFGLTGFGPILKTAAAALTQPQLTLAGQWWHLIVTHPQAQVATRLAQQYQQLTLRERLH
ncbi:hypothetical protein ACFP1L_08825 [Lactiplantibacillus nangangensis]|uniref:Glutamate--cysteine ligase n=1 Tax=Lactiplantibacillus nangangensis TaxID=2559917 RepID=A0ABW1SKB9_9LACO|nr:hypothetical protein [Lactiplantibacillus nangangensis]